MKMDESEYKEIGEKLAGEAVKAGLKMGQLRLLYKLAKMRPIPFMEAWVKRQIARSAEGGRGSPQGFDQYGPIILEVMERFKDDKGGLQKVLTYTIMLFEYVKLSAKPVSTAQRGRSMPSGTVRETAYALSDESKALRERLEPIVNRVCNRYGLIAIEVSKERGGWRCNVRLRRFRENPRALSENLVREVVSQFPELSGSIRFWIDMNERR